MNDHTLLSADEQQFLHDCATRAKDANGCGVELGAYRGGSTRIIAEALGMKLVHVYEAFGIPASQVDADSKHVAGEFSADEAEVRAYLADLKNIIWHVGVFPDTFLEIGEVAFAHLDCDTYAGTRAALERFVPRLSEGGLILVDDYDWPATPGVTRAVDEAEARFAVTVERRAKKAVVARQVGA